jgi:hypothetical protein
VHLWRKTSTNGKPDHGNRSSTVPTMLELQRKTVGVAIGYGAWRPRFVRIGMRFRDDQLLITTVIVSASISHQIAQNPRPA